jgi:hypothetical protein
LTFDILLTNSKSRILENVKCQDLPPIPILVTWLSGKFEKENQLNWNAIFSASEEEGVSALLYTFLKDKDIPSNFKDSLKASYLRNYFQNTKIINELNNLSSLFVKEDIPFIPLKGAALILKVYNDIAHRPMDDIDLLVDEDDIKKTNDILLSNGYSPTEVEYRLCWRRFGGKREYIKENFLIDLHFCKKNLKNNRKDFLYSRIINEMRFINIKEKNITIPSPEDLITHLLYHMTYHHFYLRLIWLFDILKILEKNRDNLFWEALQEKIINLNLIQPAYYTLMEIKSLFCAPVPDWFISSITPSKNYFGILMKIGKREMIGHTVKFLKIPGLKNKFLFLFGAFFPNMDYLKLHYNTNSTLITFLYFIFRPFFIIGKFIKNLN